MKRERLHLSRHQSIETYRDWNGRAYIACSSTASMLFRDVGELRKWLKLPKGIASRDSFDSWIASLEAADQERVSKRAEPLTQQLLESGFGPECHLDDDPTANTKMIT